MTFEVTYHEEDDMTFHGYTPEPWQKAVHEAIGANPKGCVFVVLSPRQAGKTVMLENEILRCSLNNRDAISICISLTLDGSRKIYRELVKAIEKSGCVRKKNDSLLYIEFITGSIVYFRSAEQGDTLRGMTIKNGGMLFVDEAAYVQDDFYYSVLLATTNVYRADILLTSTPKFKTGFFYNYYQQGRDGREGILSFNFKEWDLSKYLPAELLERYREVMPKSQFTTEYLGEFLDGDSVLFEGFKDCISSARSQTEKVYMGIDWSAGIGKDRTAISIINQDGQQIHSEAFNNLNTTATVKRIARIYKDYQQYNPVIYAETNGIGRPYCDLLTEQRIQINEWTTTNKSKTDMVAHLQVAFEQGDISLLDDQLQQAELSYYEAQYNPKTGNVAYNAPMGLHDDTVIALGLSWEAYLSRAHKGVYNIGVVRNRY